jgi:hypothetical protein
MKKSTRNPRMKHVKNLELNVHFNVLYKYVYLILIAQIKINAH